MNRIKEIRTHRRITQTKVANYLNVGRNTISRYENGEREPDNETLQKLADFFECSTDYILGRSDVMNGLNQDDNASDIAGGLEEQVRLLEMRQDGLMFFGQPMDDETREILITNLKHTIEMGKRFARTGKPTAKDKIDELMDEFGQARTRGDI